MRHILLTLFMIIAVGVFAIAEGGDRGTRQQKEARQQNEGCQLIPNKDLSPHKTNEQDTSLMKGLVF